MGAVATIARVLHVLLLSLWLGASAFFMVQAPTLFDVIGSRQEVVDVLTRSLAQIDLFGLAAGPLLLLTLLAGWVPLQVPLRLRALAAVAMTAAVAASGRYVTPQLSHLRARMGRPLEDMDPTHLLMERYEQLHTVSAGLMITHVALALLLVVAAVAASKPRRSFGIEL